MSDARPRLARVILHPLLNVPRLAASTPDIVLSRGIEHPSQVALVFKLTVEVERERLLSLVRGAHTFGSFADNRDGGLPDPWVEERAQYLKNGIRPVARALRKERFER